MADEKSVQPKQKTGFITKVQKIFTGEHEKEQSRKKAFTLWINWKLSTKDPRARQIRDLTQDIQDGELLFDLMEVLLGHNLETAREEEQEPRQKVHKALHVLYMNGFNVTSISSGAVAGGDETAILKLLKTIILHSQVNLRRPGDGPKVNKKQNPETKLLQWCQGRTRSYRRVKIADFSLSWRDGLAFNAVLHSQKPNLFEFRKLYEVTPRDRLEHAFSLASQAYAVPQLLEANDLSGDKPDRALVMMYVGAIYAHFEGPTPDTQNQAAFPDGGKAINGSATDKVPQEGEEGSAHPRDQQDGDGDKHGPPEVGPEVQELIEKLNEVKREIEEAGERKPVYSEHRSNDSLETCTEDLEKTQEFARNLEPLKSKVAGVLSEGRHLINAGSLNEAVSNVLKSIKDQMEEMTNGIKNQEDQLLEDFNSLVEQQLERISQWSMEGEEKMDRGGWGETGADASKEGHDLEEIKSDDYDGHEEAEKEIANYQKFQEKRPDVALLDGENPHIKEEMKEELQALDLRWRKVWDWCEKEKDRLTALLGSWTNFQSLSAEILDWLERTLPLLHQVAEVDVADQAKVDSEQEKLEDAQRELDEQDSRLKELEQHGKKLSDAYSPASQAAEHISARLLALNRCWMEAGKKMLSCREWLITSNKKMKEFQEYMDSVNEWIEEAQKVMSEYDDSMSKKEKTLIKDKVEIKCEERPVTEKKVERLTRLGEDLGTSLRGPRAEAVREDVLRFKDRWQEVTAALESFSDKGYQERNNECCLLRLFKRKALV